MGHSNEFEVVRFSAENHPHLIKPFTEIYTHIFSLPPWHESRGCSTQRDDHPNIPLGYIGENCPACGAQLKQYWSGAEVEKSLFALSTGNNTVHLLLTDTRLAGFSMGEVTNPESLERELNLPTTAHRLRAQFESEVCCDRVGYLKDIGIIPEFQSRGLANLLYEARYQHFQKEGCTVLVARTMAKHGSESKTYLWYRDKKDFVTIAQYENDPRCRVIQAKRIA